MSRTSTQELWKAMAAAEHVQACVDYLNDPNTDEDEVCASYARFMRVRPVFWRRKGREQRAQDLAKVLHNPDFKSARHDALKAYLLATRKTMLCDFLDALNIAHVDGKFTECPPQSLDALKAAAKMLCAKYGEHDCWLYFGFLLCHDIDDGPWENLPPIFDAIDRGNGSEMASTTPSSEGHVVPVQTSVENPVPEPPDEFTTLDELVIKSIVASASNTEGSFTRQKIDDLVDEIVSLNVDRRRSYFHRGFFHALFDVNFEFSFAAENHERRCWYMTGVLMGLLRQGGIARDEAGAKRYITDIVHQHRAIISELITDSGLGSGKVVAVGLYPHLIEANEVALAAAMIARQTPRLSRGPCFALLQDALRDGGRFLREGKLGEAHLLLAEALAGLTRLTKGAEGSENYDASCRQALRKMGQCQQALGNFPEAKKYLERVVGMGDSEERREALTDLGLIKAGFKSLRSILPSRDPDGWPILLINLGHGKDYFHEAIRETESGEVRGVRNAHFALGMIAILGKTPDPRAAGLHFERAFAGMLRRREAYSVGGVLEWTRFLLALSYLEQLDPAFTGKARELIDESIGIGDQFAICLWRRSLDAAAVMDDLILCQQIVEYLFEKRADEVFDAIRGSSALLRNEWLRRRYNEMLSIDKRLTIKERFAEWKALLKICQTEGDAELAAEVLSQLEDFSFRDGHLCAEFAALLADSSFFSPGWESEDAETARARALEILGRLHEAGSIYERRFYALAERGTDFSIAQAREYFEKLRKLALPQGLADLERRLEACEESLKVDEPGGGAEVELKSGAKVKLLYVGGNESQQSFDDKIVQRLNDEFPGVEVIFSHPGWGSNWARSLADVERLIPKVDLVILSPLVRTQFGRNLRKLCNDAHPWFASTAKGQSGIRESIKRFAILAQKRKKAASANAS